MADDYSFSQIKKIFRGSYLSQKQGRTYAEENFEVFRDTKEQSHSFVSEIHSRVSTGELLKIVNHYKINNNYIPIDVSVEKFLGNDYSKETYMLDINTSMLTYTFAIIVDSRIKKWKGKTFSTLMKLMEPYQIERTSLEQACEGVKAFIQSQSE